MERFVDGRPEAGFRVNVDPTNPGQFFACCGLMEMADRLWNGAEGWFDNGKFSLRLLNTEMATDAALAHLLKKLSSLILTQVDPEDPYSTPIKVPTPFNFTLGWWQETDPAVKQLKTWAGTMQSFRIACAMQKCLSSPDFHVEDLFNVGRFVFDPEDRRKKVEPYYFDARRGANARPIDVGFSHDPLKMVTMAFPAVEFLCLIGLQRFRPMPADKKRVFEYFTWVDPLDAHIAPIAACGLLRRDDDLGYRFEVAFRTPQRKHKAFTSANPFRRRR